MVSTRQHRPHGYQIAGQAGRSTLRPRPLPGRLGPRERPPPADPRPPSAAKELSVAVHDGRLSVDVQEADLAEVLAHIGRQAGIRISAGPSAGKRVSASFTGVALEDGLRRLLRWCP